ncbi:NAD-dependent epimerase/dehydratase family protein [Nocardia sp. NPDC050710]|uniref:NAD-dependent epimerase/dehydratase family protein n=1 Tax=Nocardia sp. NPDC050710 TaxID=3157220 RepID=UPI0033E01A26
MSTVLVTGATGFIAGHVIEDLLRHGYAVRGTVRDLRAESERAHLVAIADQLGGQLDFVAADLSADQGWEAAVDGCDAIMHLASPIPLKHAELRETPCAGMRRVLTAAVSTSTVRRIVVTSSTDAITEGHADRRARTSRDWSVVERCSPYSAGKTLAEQWAWRFISGLPAEHRVEMVSILPGLVLGPIQRAATSTSHEPVSRLMSGSFVGPVRVGWAPVDVRDLAIAHRLALETADAAGRRYVCAGPNLWMREIAATLAAEFGPRGWRVPTRELPDALVRLSSVADAGVRMVVPNLGHPVEVDASDTCSELGWEMRPVTDTVISTAESLIEYGIVGPPRTPRRKKLGQRRRSGLTAFAGVGP